MAQSKGLICFFVQRMRPTPAISRGILRKPRSMSGIAYPSRERPARGHQNILVLRNAPSKTRCMKRPIVKAKKFFRTVFLLTFLPIVDNITAIRNPTTVTTLNTGVSAPTITQRYANFGSRNTLHTDATEVPINQNSTTEVLQCDEAAAMRTLWKFVGGKFVQATNFTCRQIEVTTAASWTVQL